MSLKSKNTSAKARVFVGLSGGVDSAVSAALLKERGFDVTGVFIKAWQPEWMRGAGGSSYCTWREERRDAMKVAIALDIPFLFFDFEEEYKRGVVDKMIAEYQANRTPNPDVLCNREIKFGAFWEKAKELGADYVATGHYARVLPSPPLGKSYPHPTEGRARYLLKEGKDKEKDQSYFLWTLTKEDLAHTLFPVGDLEKTEVRKLAEKYKLPVADKKDSQGICFLGDVSMGEFLSHFIVSVPGKVLDTKGKVIGSHQGVVHYTIGERHGFEVTKKSPESGAFYIISKDGKKNTITVSDKEAEIVSSSPSKILIRDASWIAEPERPEISARIRYRGEKLPITLTLVKKKLAVEFAEPVRGLSLGQSIVFYDGETCLGGGIMDKVLA